MWPCRWGFAPLLAEGRVVPNRWYLPPPVCRVWGHLRLRLKRQEPDHGRCAKDAAVPREEATIEHGGGAGIATLCVEEGVVVLSGTFVDASCLNRCCGFLCYLLPQLTRRLCYDSIYLIRDLSIGDLPLLGNLNLRVYQTVDHYFFRLLKKEDICGLVYIYGYQRAALSLLSQLSEAPVDAFVISWLEAALRVHLSD